VAKEKKVDQRRSKLIGQLRRALYLAESPQETCIEFDILETTFELEFDE
jgi:hypothetical protein